MERTQGNGGVGWVRTAAGVGIFLAMAVVWTMAVQAIGEAPDAAALKAIAGKEKKAHEQTNSVTPALTPAEARAVAATIQALRQMLLNSPALQALRGYDWATFGLASAHEAGRPIKARLGYIAYPYFFNARMNRAESSAEGAPFTIYVNDPDIVLGQNGYHVDEDARFTFAPLSTGADQGFPAYIAGEHFVVMTRDSRPLYVPVTVQRYLDLRIAQARTSLAATKSSLASMPDGPGKATALAREEGRLTALEKELSSLSESERSAPALFPDDVKTSRPSFLAEAGTTKTRAIVMPNPDLFDPKKPRTAVQLIVLGSIRYQPELFAQVQAGIDKGALAKLLD